jgi:hypothetical protein
VLDDKDEFESVYDRFLRELLERRLAEEKQKRQENVYKFMNQPKGGKP